MNFIRKTMAGVFASAALAAATLVPSAQAQEDTIKVGGLHSLSGTMAISETTLKDVMLMLIDEQNKKGGLLGKKLEAVVVDPASDWPLFAEKARELITADKVAAAAALVAPDLLARFGVETEQPEVGIEHVDLAVVD